MGIEPTKGLPLERPGAGKVGDVPVQAGVESGGRGDVTKDFVRDVTPPPLDLTSCERVAHCFRSDQIVEAGCSTGGDHANPLCVVVNVLLVSVDLLLEPVDHVLMLGDGHGPDGDVAVADNLVCLG